MAVKTYNPADVQLIVAGIPVEGYAAGTFINAGRINESWRHVVGAAGEVARAKSNDKSGLVTLTLLQTALTNDLLSGLATLDEASGDGVGPLFLKDFSGRTLLTAGSCWIRKPADSEFGQEISNREWAIVCDELLGLTGGN